VTDWIIDAAPALAVAVAIGAVRLSYLSLRVSRSSAGVLPPAGHRAAVCTREDVTIMRSSIPAGKPELDFETRNVGMGPALNVRGQCGMLVEGMVWAIGHTPHPVNFAAGDSANLTFVADEKGQMLSLHSELAARFVYEDVGWQTFWTSVQLGAGRDSHWCWQGRGRQPKEENLLKSGPPPVEER
jgi:hypothetical protein